MTDKLLKVPAAIEDLEIGRGLARQVRNDQEVTVHKIHVPVAVETTNELADIDVSKYKYARLGWEEYVYKNDATEGLPTWHGNGKWVKGGFTTQIETVTTDVTRTLVNEAKEEVKQQVEAGVSSCNNNIVSVRNNLEGKKYNKSGGLIEGSAEIANELKVDNYITVAGKNPPWGTEWEEGRCPIKCTSVQVRDKYGTSFIPGITVGAYRPDGWHLKAMFGIAYFGNDNDGWPRPAIKWGRDSYTGGTLSIAMNGQRIYINDHYGGTLTTYKGETETASDSRYKKDVKYNDGKELYEKIKMLKPVSFKYCNGLKPDNKVLHGFIAQEVELIDTRYSFDVWHDNVEPKAEIKHIDYSNIAKDAVTALIHAISKIEKLEETVANLVAKVEKLEKKNG